MNSRNIAVLVLFAFLVAAPAMAFEHSTVKKHHAAEASDDDSNIIGFQSGIGIAGANFGEPQGVQSPNSGSRVLLNMGAFYEHRFIPYFGFRAELDFSQRGYSLSDNNAQVNDPNAASNNYTLSYLEIPLLMKTQFKAGIVTPYFATGPFFGFLVGKNLSVSQGGQTEDQPITNVNSFNFGIDFGAGCAIEVARHFNIEIGARYSMGLINLESTPQGQVAQPGQDTETIKSNSIQIMTGLAYSI